MNKQKQDVLCSQDASSDDESLAIIIKLQNGDIDPLDQYYLFLRRHYTITLSQEQVIGVIF